MLFRSAGVDGLIIFDLPPEEDEELCHPCLTAGVNWIRLTTPTSLDRTIGDDDSNELVDLLPDANPGPESVVMDRAEEAMVTGLLDVLDERARYAVEQRFGLHDGRKRSYREVGEDLGVTAEAARRLVKRAVNTVREHAPAAFDAA